MKTRSISFKLGMLDSIKVPTDWRKVKGITAKRIETNMGLAIRDYSVECYSGSEPLMIVEGFWIWWCKTHNQPSSICQLDKIESQFNNIIDKFNSIGFVRKPIQ